jgi:type II secretory pathway pseudopilin PulG
MTTGSRPNLASARGFTLTELLVAAAVTMTVTGLAVSTLQDSTRASEAASVLSDVNQTLRVAMNTLIRDLSQAGEGDYNLRTGVSIPSGAGAALIVRPSRSGISQFFPDRYTMLPAVSPGSGLGASINGIATDVVTLLFEDRSIDFTTVTPAIADDGASMTFPVGFDMGTGMAAIQAGDLFRFGSGAIQEVTSVSERTVSFAAEAGSNLNQRDGVQGSIMELRGEAASFPATAVSRVTMITYYLSAPAAGMPQLIRRVNFGGERVIAIGVENLQLTWDLVNGADNPTNVETFDVNVLEGQIRKVNLYMAARSLEILASTDMPLRNSVATQVSLRSLAFVSRYDLQ